MHHDRRLRGHDRSRAARHRHAVPDIRRGFILTERLQMIIDGDALSELDEVAALEQAAQPRLAR